MKKETYLERKKTVFKILIHGGSGMYRPLSDGTMERINRGTHVTSILDNIGLKNNIR